MATSSTTRDNRKVSFGFRKKGKAKKSYNKHETRRVYRGQGRG